ncbi:MAG: hypothetical protein JNM93_13170 [Bacteriovoracaceae bacterium]|nr:hypothetical protein [Bacteriovoracaceae bacterium]
MKHVFFIDPLEKLNTRKDSSLLMALTFKNAGKEVYFLFENDFYILNHGLPTLEVYEFDGKFHEGGAYLSSMSLKGKVTTKLEPKDVIHMRLDPPFNGRYLKNLWLLDFLHHQGVRIVNNPKGIMYHNEKLFAFKQKDMSVHSYTGQSEEGFHSFMIKLKDAGFKELVLKPMDGFSGIGVEKLDLNNKYLIEAFNRKVKETMGPVIAQPFMEEVYKGEVRSIFYAGRELGSILKTPQQGEFLSNIAQGATFEKYTLPSNIRAVCEEIAWDLKEYDVPFIAFDILGNNITEINLTCPGLLVEVSHAYKTNLANEIVKSF